ncbi:M42 family metallopeptidase [Planomicrobium sp. CPCC 101079]|uniref:M42 family metallopeptidase n=1 Tax=Planomicrobium sp. CPCC 101079 TaxID=2599618 RepID=UPI0011B83CA4|nr:M20/M25/M40 family metallo-hydrolase [Planomicrobium sp. CPCC 101079]TWT01832.1 M42 family metallopeptidase [Planomicrobium sp. CPCC 101079]
MFKEEFYRNLKELAALPGSPGREQQVVKRMVELLEPYAEVEVDHMGNVYAVMEGNKPGPTVMVSSHSDEIGCMVSAIDGKGFLRMERTGGMMDSLLVGRKVNVNGHFGVIGVKAGHLQTAAEKTKVLPIEDMYVDVGASSREEVLAMGINIGDSITYISDLDRFTNQDLICGKAIDNRSCCVLLVELFKTLQDKDFSGKLVGLVAVQEEVGLRGAQIAGYKIDPDFAIVLDTIACADTPDGNYYPIAIGKGPVLPLLSGSATGNIMSPQMKALITSYADKLGIPYQLSVMSKGTTDLSSIHLVKEGIHGAAITFPRRYSHSPVEMANLSDFEAGFRLLEAMLRDSGNWGDLSFV